MKCERCGEEALDPRPVCFHCGAPVDHTPRGPYVPSPRFALAEQHPEYTAACACDPDLPDLKLGPPLVGVLFGVVFLVFSILIGSKLDHFPPFIYGWVLISLVFIAGSVQAASAGLWAAFAPTRHVLAVVVEESHQTEHIVKRAGTAHEERKQKQHYMLRLQTRDGKQKWWRCSAKIAGKIDVGCIGVAITRGPLLLKFIDLPVPLA